MQIDENNFSDKTKWNSTNICYLHQKYLNNFQWLQVHQKFSYRNQAQTQQYCQFIQTHVITTILIIKTFTPQSPLEIHIAMQHRFNTPQRSNLLQQPLFSQQLSTRRYNNSHHSHTHSHQRNFQSGVDYKSKTFELMQVVTQMQMRQKQQQKTIFYFQRQLEIIHKQLQEFLEQFGMRSLSDVKEKCIKLGNEVQELKRASDKPLIKQQKLTSQYQKILREYKSILGVQQQKLSRYQLKWKQKQNSFLQQLQKSAKQQKHLKDQLKQTNISLEKQKTSLQSTYNEEIKQLKLSLEKQKETSQSITQQQIKLKNELNQLQQSNTELTSDMQLLKHEFRQLLIQKQSLEERHQRLKKKYKQEIQHFEMIEKQVEEKLIEVEKEITFYKEERELNLQQIKALRYENDQLRLERHEEFSFGGENNVETQTDESHLSMESSGNQMTVECYEISIKSLLEENMRLKRTLVLLDRSKRGEDLPVQAQLELKLLKGLTGNGEMKRQMDKDKQRQKLKEKDKKENDLQIQLENMRDVEQIDMVSPKFRHELIGQSRDENSYQIRIRQVEKDEDEADQIKQ